MPDTAHGFQFHPGTEAGADVTEFLIELADSRSNTRLGSTIHVPRRRLTYWQEYGPQWNTPVDFLLADPECGRMDRPFDDRGTGRKDFAYLGESNPAANPEGFVDEVLSAQRMVGASALVSPWLLHGLSQTEHELTATVSFATAAESLVEDEKLLMGVEATEGALANVEARNALVNELVEGPELPVYFRMRVTAPPGQMQYRNQAALEGLRDVVVALEANDRPVALPQSGLTGWLMNAHGARSFGAGFQGSMQRNSPPSGGGGGFPRLHWYFVPQLLGFVQAEEMEDVVGASGFAACDCPYCAGELPGTGAGFDARAADKHFIWWCSTLSAELTPSSRVETISERVENAIEFAAKVEDKTELDDRSKAVHLTLWSELLP
jgi:hypothetical protein